MLWSLQCQNWILYLYLVFTTLKISILNFPFSRRFNEIDRRALDKFGLQTSLKKPVYPESVLLRKRWRNSIEILPVSYSWLTFINACQGKLVHIQSFSIRKNATTQSYCTYCFVKQQLFVHECLLKSNFYFAKKFPWWNVQIDFVLWDERFASM